MKKGFKCIDELGRIIIPKDARAELGWCKKKGDTPGTPITFKVDGNKLILESAEEPSCPFCGSKDEVFKYKNGSICIRCYNGIRKE